MSMEAIEAGIAGQCPLGRVAVPRDISRVVAFLAHEESEWINGKQSLHGGPQRGTKHMQVKSFCLREEGFKETFCFEDLRRSK